MKNALKISAIILVLFLLYSCKKDKVPTLTTTEVSNITATTATSGGTITDEGNSTVTSRGVCWSTGTTPTITDNKTTDGAGVGSFTSNLSGLNGAFNYYVRAYATNTAGTGYGMAMSFETLNAVGDYDGNIYNTVTIGTQVWMKENLKTTKYSNGDLIGTTAPTNLDIYTESAPKYQWAYDGNESNVDTYGRLYTWYAVTDSRNICPAGWHVPTYEEWTTLTNFLGGENVAGGKLKEIGTTHWLSPNLGATDESGFAGLPGGYRESGGTYFLIGNFGYWWSSTEFSTTDALFPRLCNSIDDLYTFNALKQGGLSVRCVKDN